MVVGSVVHVRQQHSTGILLFVAWAWERVPLFQAQIQRWQIPTLPMPLDAGFEQGHLNDARHLPAQAWTFLRW